MKALSYVQVNNDLTTLVFELTIQGHAFQIEISLSSFFQTRLHLPQLLPQSLSHPLSSHLLHLHHLFHLPLLFPHDSFISTTSLPWSFILSSNSPSAVSHLSADTSRPRFSQSLHSYSAVRSSRLALLAHRVVIVAMSALCSCCWRLVA